MSAVAEAEVDFVVRDDVKLYDAAATIKRMGLEGKKSPRWLEDQARADRIYFTPVGKTLMWSEQDMRDNLVRMRHAPRNKFAP